MFAGLRAVGAEFDLGLGVGGELRPGCAGIARLGEGGPVGVHRVAERQVLGRELVPRLAEHEAHLVDVARAVGLARLLRRRDVGEVV